MIVALLAGLVAGAAGRITYGRLRRRAWITEANLLTGEANVRPIADVVEHDLGDECVCGPEVVPVEGLDGVIRWLYRHHSLDGREKRGSVPQ